MTEAKTMYAINGTSIQRINCFLAFKLIQTSYYLWFEVVKNVCMHAAKFWQDSSEYGFRPLNVENALAQITQDEINKRKTLDDLMNLITEKLMKI